jgi:NitT/TauT family transport system ATP-binding protein
MAGTIRVVDLQVRYPGRSRNEEGTLAIEGINLEVRAGEVVTVVGPSGCGKTTLLNVIAGLVRATSGRVLINDAQVTKPGPDRAVVFQDYALLPWRTVHQNIRLGLEMQPRLREGSEERIRRAIELIGLQGFEQARPFELSGGMQQRVGLARALVADPEVLLMDEPFGAVDAMTREVMRIELERVLAASRSTVLFITHSIDEAILLADRVAVFAPRPGRITDVFDVNLPRPRSDESIRAEPEYLRLRDALWNCLRSEAVKAALEH